MKGWGSKSLVCPSKPRENILLVGYPGTGDFGSFARISRLCPKTLRTKSLCSVLAPIPELGRATEKLGTVRFLEAELSLVMSHISD